MTISHNLHLRVTDIKMVRYFEPQDWMGSPSKEIRGDKGPRTKPLDTSTLRSWGDTSIIPQ